MKTPLFEFKAPDPSASLEDGLAEHWREGQINITEVAKWLVRRGVLTLADRHKPQSEWHYPHGASSNVITNFIRLKRECDVPLPSYRLGLQIVDHLETAQNALAGDGSLDEFFQPLFRAQDAARAAYEAGYTGYPVPDLCDFTTGMIAATAEMLCDEIMRRSLAGAIAPGEATEALAALSPQAKENARWWRDRYGGPTTKRANKD